MLIICKTGPSYEPELMKFGILSCAKIFQRTLTSSLSVNGTELVRVGKAIDK